jgi:hypothetical protein
MRRGKWQSTRLPLKPAARSASSRISQIEGAEGSSLSGPALTMMNQWVRNQSHFMKTSIALPIALKAPHSSFASKGRSARSQPGAGAGRALLHPIEPRPPQKGCSKSAAHKTFTCDTMKDVHPAAVQAFWLFQRRTNGYN